MANRTSKASDAVAAQPAPSPAEQEAAKPYALQEVGGSGLRISGGFVHEELLTELIGDRGRRIYKQMADNDGIVGAFLFALSQMMSRLDWKFEAPPNPTAEEEAATEFMQGCLDDMSTGWDAVLEDILTFATYGWSYLEVIYKIRRGPNEDDGSFRSKFTDGKIGWRKFALRGQSTLLRWETDDNDNVQGMTQTLERGTVTIPLTKALLFRTTQAMNNPEGRSLLRSAYRPWYFKTRIEEYEAIGIERDLAGYPIVRTPPRWHTAEATAQEKVALENAKTLARSMRRGESEGVVLPALYDEDGNLVMDVTLISSPGTRQIDINATVTRKNQEIAMSVLADFLLLGHEANGSRALGTVKVDLWTLAISALAKNISTTIDAHATPKLLRLNGMNVARLPRLTYGEVNRVDLSDLGGFLKVLVDGGILTPDEDLEDWARLLIKAPARMADPLALPDDPNMGSVDL